MHFVCIIYLLCLQMLESRGEAFIALRDYNFNTEDQVLKKNLARRIYVHVEDKNPSQSSTARTSALNRKAYPEVPKPHPAYGPQLNPEYKPAQKPDGVQNPNRKPDQGRQVAIARKPDLAQMPLLTPKPLSPAEKKAILRTDHDHEFLNNPTGRDIRRKFIGLMRQSIFGSQMRIKEMLLYTEKYDESVKYRVGFMFKQLKILESQMEIHFTILKKWFDYSHTFHKHYSTLSFYIYYSHSFKNFIDITYIVENIIEIYQDLTKDQRAEALVTEPPSAVDLSKFIPGANIQITD